MRIDPLALTPRTASTSTLLTFTLTTACQLPVMSAGDDGETGDASSPSVAEDAVPADAPDRLARIDVDGMNVDVCSVDVRGDGRVAVSVVASNMVNGATGSVSVWQFAPDATPIGEPIELAGAQQAGPVRWSPTGALLVGFELEAPQDPDQPVAIESIDNGQPTWRVGLAGQQPQPGSFRCLFGAPVFAFGADGEVTTWSYDGSAAPVLSRFAALGQLVAQQPLDREMIPAGPGSLAIGDDGSAYLASDSGVLERRDADGEVVYSARIGDDAQLESAVVRGDELWVIRVGADKPPTALQFDATGQQIGETAFEASAAGSTGWTLRWSDDGSQAIGLTHDEEYILWQGQAYVTDSVSIVSVWDSLTTAPPRSRVRILFDDQLGLSRAVDMGVHGLVLVGSSTLPAATADQPARMGWVAWVDGESY